MGKKMNRWKTFFIWAFLVTINTSSGCSIQGVDFNIPQNVEIFDTDVGKVIFQKSTSDIIGAEYRLSDLNGGPYFDVILNDDGELIISTIENFAQYERYEFVSVLGITITLRCAPPATSQILVVTVNIIDTNNHAPEFLPSNQYDVTLTPPLPPNYEITGCLTDITVRDIDLTTSAIIFALTEESELFEIAFDAENTVPLTKEFKAVLRTKTFIRSLPETIELRISATDVDATGNEPITEYATVKIRGDTEFKLPEELVFSKPFYFAQYTTANTIILEESISLQEGYHEDVKFSLDGEFAANFNLSESENENKLNLVVDVPLLDDVLRTGQIILVIKAEREFTSGATTTVIVQLPEVAGLKFAESNFESNIIDNTLIPVQLKLIQGYEESYTVSIASEYESYFNATGQDDIITLTMSLLDSTIIEQNNFINLVITASNPYSSASTTLTLGIIKDDTVTPAFGEAIYKGSYDAEMGVTLLQDITLVQGYDETVVFDFDGEHKNLFQLTHSGPVVTLTSSEIPPAILAEQRVLLTVLASKPRTVSARATVYIDLPSVAGLQFLESNFESNIIDNTLIPVQLKLSKGYEQVYMVSIAGEYESYFNATGQDDIITLTMSPLDSTIIEQNNFINLVITASNPYSSASTTLTLGIIKDDTVTPAFGEAIYKGSYDAEMGVTLLQDITLVQGYDETVVFDFDGEHKNLFQLTHSGPVVTLTSSEIPPAILAEQRVLLTVLASKPRTVSARATVYIDLPSVAGLQFLESNFESNIIDNTLIPVQLKLSKGYEQVYMVSIAGEYESYFNATGQDDIITLTMSPLDSTIIEQNNFINLVITASNPYSSASTTLTLGIIKDDTVTPAFGEAIYKGSYDAEMGVTLLQDITLVQGYDETVVFDFDGEHKNLFQLSHSGPMVTLTSSEIPPVVLTEQRILLTVHASKPRTVGARAVVYIDLPLVGPANPEITFDKVFYEGRIEDNIVQHETITLNGYDGTEIEISGRYADFFKATNTEGNVQVETTGPLTLSESDPYVALKLYAGGAETVLLLTIIRTGGPTNPEISFDKVYYEGEIQDDIVRHENITLNGYDGTEIEISGRYADFFKATNTEGNVQVETTGPLPLSESDPYVALKLYAGGAETVLLLTIIRTGGPTNPEISFDKVYYEGEIQDDIVRHENITLNGYDGTEIEISGRYADFFKATNTEGNVQVETTGPLPLSESDPYVALQLNAGGAETVLLLTIIRTGGPTNPEISFDKVLYEGEVQDNIIRHENITLNGYDGTEIEISGRYADFFIATNTEGNVQVETTGPLTLSESDPYVALQLYAGGAETVLLLTIIRTGGPTNPEISFDKVYYEGEIQDDIVRHENITLNGYVGTEVEVSGRYADFFKATHTEGNVQVETTGPLPLSESDPYVALQLNAGGVETVLFLSIINRGSPTNPEISFDKVYYEGEIQDNIVRHETIILNGYDGTEVEISGRYADFFKATNTEGNVQVETTGPLTLSESDPYVALQLYAGGAETVLLLTIIRTEGPTNPEISFDKVFYEGEVQDNIVRHENITLNGYDGTEIEISGRYADFFIATNTEGNVQVETTGPLTLSESDPYVALQLYAGGAETVLLLTIIRTGGPTNPEISFDKVYYEGEIQDDIVRHENITLNGYDGTEIEISGRYADFFKATNTEGNVQVETTGPLPLSESDPYVALQLNAGGAETVLLLSIIRTGVPTNPEISFDKVFYEGEIQDNIVRHENITLTGYDVTEIDISGRYADFFKATNTEGNVQVETTGPLTLSESDPYVALQLYAGGAETVLLLTIIQTETTDPPVVSFGSPTYELKTDSAYIGILGRISATADNNEDLEYSLDIDDANLQQRLSISSDGELRLSAPASIGVYNFQAIATTRFTKATGAAQVTLKVNDIENDNKRLAPLQLLEIEEEQQYRNLVSQEFESCRYSLTNLWPADQVWLYVDETGLHTNAIDREHESIAFMAVSQIQVELVLECDNDESFARQKRSLNVLGPYEYGDNRWVLTNSIPYNPKRTVVNVIVEDINDNAPIFEGKENEPVIVGYPIPELEERVLPRALIQLKATDADIGLNAVIRYSSEEEALAVAPTTGLVHVRNNALLQNDLMLTVKATDRDGAADGLTGYLNILVKLLEANQIAVLTVNNAFLDEETTIIANLSTALDYEVRALRSTIISGNEEVNGGNSRKKRDAATTDGAIMLVYVYGLIEREPVDVSQLTEDINNVNIASVSIVSTVSLEDHLTAIEICNTTGLLVATIVLAILLFILILAVAIWFFLRWRKDRNYDEFSDTNSLASRDVPVTQPKPQPFDISAAVNKSRLNIEDLRRSEKRLQEMLDAPIKEEVSEPKQTISKEAPTESIINMSIPDPKIPIVIQSIDKLKSAGVESDDEDEFGEVNKSKRKSVVTFNENVEKIIHVEDNPNDDESLPDYEIYKF